MLLSIIRTGSSPSGSQLDLSRIAGGSSPKSSPISPLELDPGTFKVPFTTPPDSGPPNQYSPSWYAALVLLEIGNSPDNGVRSKYKGCFIGAKPVLRRFPGSYVGFLIRHTCVPRWGHFVFKYPAPTFRLMRFIGCFTAYFLSSPGSHLSEVSNVITVRPGMVGVSDAPVGDVHLKLVGFCNIVLSTAS